MKPKVGHEYKEEQFQWNDVYSKQTGEGLEDYQKTGKQLVEI